MATAELTVNVAGLPEVQAFVESIIAQRDAAWTALDEIAEGDTCLHGVPDDELGADGEPCICAHHWALYALAAAMGVTRDPITEQKD